eukprot:s2715_g12.t1
MASEVPDTQASNWDEVQECQRCGEQTKLSEGAVQKATGLHCKSCANIYQMMYRHLGGLPQTLQSMTTSEQKTFWKKSSEILKVTPRNGRWSQVRSSLVTEMCRFQKEQTTRRVRREFHPLSVWEKRGYDTALIQERGQKEDNPASGLKFSGD